MKIAILIALLVVICVALTQAQRCANQPRRPTCNGPRDVGNSNQPRCRRDGGDRWYWNARQRQCIRMRYLGCGGNLNRWCSRAECDRGCRRPQ